MSYPPIRFTSVSDFVARASRVPSGWHTGGHDSPLSYSDILTRLTSGDERHVKDAEKLIDQLHTALDFDSYRNEWVPDVQGAFPCIPDYLANRPNPMRRLRKNVAPGAPFGLWIDVISSAGVSLEKLKKRGICCLALGMYLQRFRPVQLHITVSTISQGAICLSLDTTPFNISVASDLLCNGETARYPMYAILRQQSGAWISSIETSPEMLRKIHCIPAGDLVLCGTHLYNEKITSDPVTWINEVAERVLKGNEGEAGLRTDWS